MSKVIYVVCCILCPMYDTDGQECHMLHRDISPYDGIDKECPLPDAKDKGIEGGQ